MGSLGTLVVVLAVVLVCKSRGGKTETRVVRPSELGRQATIESLKRLPLRKEEERSEPGDEIYHQIFDGPQVNMDTHPSKAQSKNPQDNDYEEPVIGGSYLLVESTLSNPTYSVHYDRASAAPPHDQVVYDNAGLVNGKVVITQ